MQLFNLMAGAMLAIAGGTMVFKAQRAITLHRQALGWPTAAGVVVRSDLREHTESEGTSYRADIACAYQVDGADYTTTHHTGGLKFSQPEQSTRALLSAFPVGQAVSVSVPPSSPADGVLIAGQPHCMLVFRRVGWVALLGGVVLGLYGLVGGA